MATADLAEVEPKLREAIEARIVAAAEATGEADPDRGTEISRPVKSAAVPLFLWSQGCGEQSSTLLRRSRATT
jgi:hypothetical protein